MAKPPPPPRKKSNKGEPPNQKEIKANLKKPEPGVLVATVQETPLREINPRVPIKPI